MSNVKGTHQGSTMACSHSPKASSYFPQIPTCFATAGKILGETALKTMTLFSFFLIILGSTDLLLERLGNAPSSLLWVYKVQMAERE